MPNPRFTLVTLAVAWAILPLAALAQSTPQPAPPAALDLGLRVGLEPKAITLLKDMSAKLAAAKTLRFTATVTYESPARTGLALAYTTMSMVTLQRPDKLRVITPGDGPATEFYYNGKTVTAFDPAANLAATVEAPPTIDAMLAAAEENAAIYFPFTDAIVADPYKDIAAGLKLAFVVGQSKVIGGVTTDILVLANDNVQVQLWIGANDKLPRMFRAQYFKDSAGFRHQVSFSNWQLNSQLPAGTFSSAQATAARHIEFARPDVAPAPPAAPAAGATKP